MIRLERVTLPAGLKALLRRDPQGDLVIYVSDALDPARQRAAVVEAIRASRRSGWRAALPPAGIALFAGLRMWLARSARALRARPTAWVPAATAVAVGATAAGIFFANAPHGNGPSTSALPPAHAGATPHQPGTQPRAHAGHRGQAQPVAAGPTAAGGSPTGRPQPAPAPTSPVPPSPTPSPAPPPAPSPIPPPVPSPPPPHSPVPTPPPPSPSPSGGNGGVCIIVLGIRVCVHPPLVSLSG
jgi:outer membrane biosynthesis protein TonB